MGFSLALRPVPVAKIVVAALFTRVSGTATMLATGPPSALGVSWQTKGSSMTVDKDTANWRLYGGGGLLVGGLLWLVGLILSGVAGMPDVGRWVIVVGVVVVAIGFFLVGYGQTGSNGAVGNNVMGKVGLWAAALGFLAW